MNNLQDLIERIVEEKVKRQRAYANKPEHQKADIDQHGQQVYDTAKDKEKQKGRDLSDALRRVRSQHSDARIGKAEHPFMHPERTFGSSLSMHTAKDRKKSDSEEEKVTFPDLRHPSGDHGKRMNPHSYTGEKADDAYPDRSGRRNITAAHDQIHADADAEGHRIGSSQKHKAEDTRASRWRKINKRSTIGAKVKRGLGKLLGIGRYSRQGKKKANLGEAYRELARDYILEALRFPKPSTDGKSKIPVLKGKGAEGPWKPHPKNKPYDSKRRTKLATTKWDVPPTKDK